MTHKQMLAIAAVIRDAGYNEFDTDGKPAASERMRAYIARDLARELRGIMASFDKVDWLDLCDIGHEYREPEPEQI